MLSLKKIETNKIFVIIGTVLVLYGYLIPWLKNDPFSLSGVRIILNGYGFLALAPLISIGVSLAVLRKSVIRPLIALISGITGMLLLILFISLVFNSETGSIVYESGKHVDSSLLFKTTGLEQRYILPRGIGFGIVISFSGMLLIFMAPLLTRENKSEDKGVQQNNCIRSLYDLRPEYTLSGDFQKSAAIFIALAVLIVTYTWCGISFNELWQNRGNAKDYLFGKELSEADLAYIEDQAARAANIKAQGMARAFQDNKYRDIPFTEQPSLQEKMKEKDELIEKYLAEMSEEEKGRLRAKTRKAAFEEKQRGYFPPETGWEKIKSYLIALVETIAIAIWGTLLAIMFAVPASLLAASNTMKLICSGDRRIHKALRFVSVFVIRRLLDACRGFNEFVMALIFVAVIGLGPFAGILALWIHTFGILGKVFSEQIEAVEEGQVEALSSTGASVLQTITFSVLPQVMPGFVSYGLLRFESNVRSAAILGFVGAGGIGFLIFDKLNGYLFREVCTMMIIIIISVSIIDFICGKLRRRFI